MTVTFTNGRAIMPTVTEVDEWLTLPYSADDDDSGSLCDDGG